MKSRTILCLLAAAAVASCGPSVRGKSSGSNDTEQGIATTAGGLTGFATATTDGAGTGGESAAGTTGGVGTAGESTTGAVTAGGTGGAGVCPPYGLACDGTALVKCNPEGSAWELLQQCNANETCDANNATCSCTPSCFMKQCGDDGCGGSCGNCPSGQACNDQSACVSTTGPDPGPGPITSNCVASGTGVNVGQKVKDIVWSDSNGQSLSLHSFCGTAPATFLIEAAGW